MRSKHILFAHGSLRKGGLHNYLLHDSKFLGAGVTKELYKMYFNKMTMVIEKPDVPIHGDLFDISGYMLRILDTLYNHPSFYYRELIGVESKELGDLKALMYFLPANDPLLSKAKHIINGNSLYPKFEE